MVRQGQGSDRSIVCREIWRCAVLPGQVNLEPRDRAAFSRARCRRPPKRYPLPQNSVMSAARFPAVLSVCVLSRGRHRPVTLRRDRAPVGTAAFPSLFESPHCGPARGEAVRRRKGACIVPDGYSGTSVSVDIGVVGAGRSIDRFAVELVARHTRVIHPAPSSTGDGIPQNSQPGGAFLAHRYEKKQIYEQGDRSCLTTSATVSAPQDG